MLCIKSQRFCFMLKVDVAVTPSLYRLSDNEMRPGVFDMKLLGGQIVVVAVYSSKKVKLYSLEVRMLELRKVFTST